jgi:hypothetical protein
MANDIRGDFTHWPKMKVIVIITANTLNPLAQTEF